MRRSSLDNVDIGIEREISSQFDDVKLVADNIDDVIRVSAAVEDGSLEAASAIAGSIQAVGAIAEDVVIVSENMGNIQGILDNIVDVQNAEENALIAIAKAAEALVSAATATSQASIATNKSTEAAVSALTALASENSAKISEDEALISATNASASEAIALASKNIAIASANTATTKASEASTSATSASASAASALADKVSAENSANTATTKANEASDSATVASTKAGEALASANSALVSENKAEKWATEDEDVEVEIGEYSAKHWAMKAQGFAEGDAINIGYDNTSSGLVATNAQNAIDELVVNTAGIHDAATITTGTLDDARLPDTISSSITGNAATTTKWASSRTITLSGDVTGSVGIDGSANVTITTTIAANSVALGTDTTGNYVAGVTQGTGISVTGTAGEGWSPTVSLTNVGTAGTYRSVTTDAQGRVTSGTNPTTVAGYGITDAYTKTEVQTALPKIGLDTTNVMAPSVGQMAWNVDENTIDVGLNGAVLQIGQEQLVRVRNSTGSTIVNGTAVMATGTLGASGRITVAPANINGSNYKYVLGVATESIAAGADGFCTVFGKVRGIQTNGANYGETWVDGDVIYVKDNNGGALTKVVPTGTQVKLPIAIVINSHATNGTLFIRVTPIDENASYTKMEVNNGFVPLSADFILDLGEI